MLRPLPFRPIQNITPPQNAPDSTTLLKQRLLLQLKTTAKPVPSATPQTNFVRACHSATTSSASDTNGVCSVDTNGVCPMEID